MTHWRVAFEAYFWTTEIYRWVRLLPGEGQSPALSFLGWNGHPAFRLKGIDQNLFLFLRNIGKLVFQGKKIMAF